MVAHAGADLLGGVAGIAGGATRVVVDSAGLAGNLLVNPTGTVAGMARGALGSDLVRHTVPGAVVHGAAETFNRGGRLGRTVAAAGQAGIEAANPIRRTNRAFYANTARKTQGAV